ncbi:MULTISPECIES: GntR family transcriptional regulator [unclassified Luteococcus]|uniref:GntR family transcriptional regulator n=1 Tax=unclassified Luteococcus TaxID=2639923 RepID=UPI00313C64C4
MLWTVNPASPTPLFEQLAALVRRAIADGKLAKGEKLPSAKELAASLEINLHTVLRAYQSLRDEGLIELRRGRGAVVIAEDPGLVNLHLMADELLAEAGRLGLAHEHLVEILEGRRA